MKGKGLLKKFIVVLCLGALISMPITVNAASKEDVVGEWDGGPFGGTFYEDGTMIDGNGDKHHYGIESGKLKVTYNDGSEEEVSFDLWRGMNPEKNPTTNYRGIVIFKMIDSGKMKAWNVYYEDSKWKFYGPLTITKKADTGSSGSSNAGSSNASASDTGFTNMDLIDLNVTEPVEPARSCEHNYDWIITAEPTETENGEYSYMCISCGDVKARQPISADVVIRRNLLKSIKDAGEGATVIFDSKSWLCYPQYVLDALKEKGTVSLKTNFTYGGKNYSFVIPAGSDYAQLEQADFYGFMYLLGVFDGMIVE